MNRGPIRMCSALLVLQEICCGVHRPRSDRNSDSFRLRSATVVESEIHRIVQLDYLIGAVVKKTFSAVKRSAVNF